MMNFEGQGATGLSQMTSGQHFASAFQNQTRTQTNISKKKALTRIWIDSDTDTADEIENLGENGNSFHSLHNKNNFSDKYNSNILRDQTNHYNQYQQQSQQIHQPFFQDLNESSGSQSTGNTSQQNLRLSSTNQNSRKYEKVSDEKRQIIIDGLNRSDITMTQLAKNTVVNINTLRGIYAHYKRTGDLTLKFFITSGMATGSRH